MCIQLEFVQDKSRVGLSRSPLHHNLEEKSSIAGPKEERAVMEDSGVGHIPAVTRDYNWAITPLLCFPPTTGTARNAPQSRHSSAPDPKSPLCL